MAPEDREDGFIISYVDDVGDQFLVEGVVEDLVATAVDQAISDGGACKILISRQGDEDE